MPVSHLLKCGLVGFLLEGSIRLANSELEGFILQEVMRTLVDHGRQKFLALTQEVISKTQPRSLSLFKDTGHQVRNIRNLLSD